MKAHFIKKNLKLHERPFSFLSIICKLIVGGYSSMGRDGKLGFKKNHEAYNARDLATSPSLPNMTSTISASVVHYNSVT